MQVEAFHKGDMDALAEAADRCLEPVWRLSITGFTTEVERLPTYVRGAKSEDDAASVTETIVAAVLTPERRKAVDSEAALLAAALTEAREHLVNTAIADGRAATVATEHEAAIVPEGTPDLDAVIDKGAPLEAPTARHLRRIHDAEHMQLCGATVSALDERSQRLVELRWRQGKTPLEVAEVFTCGAAAVSAHERRVRRRIYRTLLKRFPDRPCGKATQDRLLTGDLDEAQLPAVTRQRLRADILKRTFQEEPAPYSVRLRWGLAAAGVAFGLWLLMVGRVLPYYTDDVYPPPRIAVTCAGACSAGRPGQVSLVAPNDSRFVALMLTGPDGKVRPLVTAPGGGSIRLPYGARGNEVRLPYPARWPSGVVGTAKVTAIFTEERAEGPFLEEVANGERAGPLTSTTAVSLTHSLGS